LNGYALRWPKVAAQQPMVLGEIAERLIASQKAVAQTLDFKRAETILYTQRFPVCFHNLLHRLRDGYALATREAKAGNFA
jgi:hypothetical protein